MKFHPYAEIFPLMEGSPFDELVADIKVYGLREKIWTYEGKILDGRNRFLACQKAKIKPEYRTFKGTGQGALAFVISANIHRRQLTDTQRAMAAARIATLRQGGDSNAPRGALTQTQAAEHMQVSRRSVQRARKVIESGSKQLQHAVESGDVPLTMAAAVTELPKSQQLAAATHKPEPNDPEIPSPEEMADIDAAIDREYTASIAKVMEADDRLVAADAEIKRQTAEIAVLKSSRDGFMNGKDAMTRLLKAEQRKTERLEKRIKELETERERLKERVAIMEAA